ncbi:hypothetical protein WMF26_16210 [Sorangium sp. So ce185]|uniref:hypothetical protein n=1 Tax=Sorangium sp. So ce185 TaxID=3133287 RepID=UPI003F6298AF
MRRFAISHLLIACLSSCTSAPPSAPGEGQVEGPPPPAAACPTEKLAFTRETGCANDGSVEFCLPAGDEALVARVRGIAPTIQEGSSPGRARCDVPAETLYFFPTGDAECVARHGALEGAAWDKICRIAALPEVRAIVPTWYE